MANFDGFKTTDFGELVGSTWRSRNTFGGVLANALKSQTGHRYQSWGVRRRLELHIAQESQYDFSDPWPFAKLFVYTHSNELAFGFYIESPKASETKDDDKFGHWRNFRRLLQYNEAMREILLGAMMNHNLVIADYYQYVKKLDSLKCKFEFRDGCLRRWYPDSQVWRDTDVEQLVQRIAELPEDQWVDLHIFARMEKQEAIAMGPGVATSILKVLRALVPLYEMVIDHQ